MTGLVERWGRTGFALAASVIWLLPMAAWAGSVDIVGGAGPWFAFAAGVVMLALWVGLVAWSRRVPVADRPRRFDVRAMGGSERRWLLGCVACGLVVIGWLNGAATVDWSLLRGGPGAAVFVGLLLAVLLAAAAGAAYCWRRASAAARGRLGQDPQ